MCGFGCIVRVSRGPIEADHAVPHPISHAVPDAIPDAWLDAMDPVLSLRGPDAKNTWRTRVEISDGATLGIAMVHHRLSVIDIADGSQPMVHEGVGEQGRVVVLFNGCIYNHRELRTELETLGHVFSTDHSDTEVLVHGWREWGKELPSHLDGMFAIVVWDEHARTLVAMRDLAGEKPVYVWDDPTAFDSNLHTGDRIVAIASASSALIRCKAATGVSYTLPEQYGDTNQQMLAWKNFGWLNHPPEIDIQQISQHELHVWAIEDNEFYEEGASSKNDTKYLLTHERTHWRHLPNRGVKQPVAFDEVKSTLGALLDTAVESRLESDVPIGCLLSGGIDSTLIAHAAQNALQRQGRSLRTFTMRMPDANYDESERAAAVAQALGTDHTTLDVQPNIAEDVVRLIEFLGLPFGDSSLLPTYWVCKAAREHVKVVLTGDGGDELFAGYERYRASQLLERWGKLIKWVPKSVFHARDPKSKSSKARRLIEAARGNGYRDLLRIDLTQREKNEWPNESVFYNFTDPMRADFSNYLPNDLLRKTDTASMFVGLEARCPMLAPQIVELGLSTPLDVLMQGNTTKPILRALARERLPSEVASRIADGPKMGFAIPIGQWFRDDTGNVRTMLEDFIASGEMFPGISDAKFQWNNALIARWLKQHDAAAHGKGRDHSQRLYLALVMAIWCRWRLRTLRC